MVIFGVFGTNRGEMANFKQSYFSKKNWNLTEVWFLTPQRPAAGANWEAS